MPTPVLSIRFTVSNLLPRLGVLALLGAPACGDDTTPGDETGSTGEDTTSGMTSPTTMTTAPSTMTMTTMGGVDSTDDGMDATDDGMVTTDDGMVTTDDGMDTTTGGEDSTSTGMDSSSGGSESSTGDSCGNDMIDAGEDCDGTDLGGMECTDVGGGFVGGTLACNTDCTFDTTACVLRDCGNGTIEGSEACEGVDLGGATCETAGFPDGGVLVCDAASCQLDTSGCFECGNGELEGTEECDDNNNMDGDGCSAACLLEEPPGDTCDNGILVDPTMLPYSDMGNTLDYNNDYGYSAGACPGEASGWNDGAEDVVYEFTPDTTGVYTIEFDATWDSTVYMVTDCADVDGTCVGGADNGNPETIVASLDAGTTYFIIGGHYSNITPGSGGNYTLTISDACIPVACDGISCGDDGCGGTCECNAGDICDTGTCVAAPQGDLCEDPFVVDPTALPYADAGDTTNFNNDYSYSSGVCPGESSGWNAANDDVVYAFTPDTTGVYTVEFTATWDSTVYIATDCSTIDTTCVAAAEATGSGAETIITALDAGTTYFIIGGYFGNFSTGGGAYDLTISDPCFPTACDQVTCGDDGCGGTCGCAAGDVCDTGACVPAPQGDTCVDPFVIDPLALPYADSDNTLNFNNDYGYSTGACPGESDGWNSGAEDVVYSFTPNASGSYTIVFNTTWDSTVYMVTDCANVDGTCVAADDNGNPETITADLTAGTTYFIIGGHWSNSTLGGGGAYDLTVTMN